MTSGTVHETRSRLRPYITLGRPSNLPTIWTNVLAGTALAAPAELDPTALLLVMLGMSALYTGGMYLNDAFDREIDRVERPERPIPSGQVSYRTVFLLAAVQLVVGAALVLLSVRVRDPELPLGPAGWAVGALVATIVLYDAWHQKSPIAPFLMGLCRALVYAGAAAAATATTPEPVVAGAIILLSWIVGLTFVARQENLATFRGVWPVLLLAAPFGRTLAALAQGGVGLAGAVLSLGFAIWALYALSFLWRPGPGSVGRAVVSMIAAISLVDATALALAGHTGLANLSVLGFFATLALQRWVRGT